MRFLQGKGVPDIKGASKLEVKYCLFIPECPKGLKSVNGVMLIDADDLVKVLH